MDEREDQRSLKGEARGETCCKREVGVFTTYRDPWESPVMANAKRFDNNFEWGGRVVKVSRGKKDKYAHGIKNSMEEKS